MKSIKPYSDAACVFENGMVSPLILMMPAKTP